MKVYVLVQTERVPYQGDDRTILGVFSTEESANAALKAWYDMHKWHYRVDVDIEPFTLQD